MFSFEKKIVGFYLIGSFF